MPGTANTRADSVRQLQRGLYRAAKAQPRRNFYSLYDMVDRPAMSWQPWEAAWLGELLPAPRTPSRADDRTEKNDLC